MKPTTRKEILDHILGIIEIPSTVSYVLENELGITSIGILINTNESALLEHNDIRLAHVTAIMLFTEWLKEYYEKHNDEPLEDWELTFTESTWNKFILKRGVDNASSSNSSSLASKSSSTAAEKDVNVSENEPTNVPKILETTEVKDIKPLINYQMPTIKIDVKSYPDFDGQLKNWKGFKQKV